MHAQHPHKTQGVRRRDLLKAGLAAGLTLSAGHLAGPSVLWGAEAGPPRRGGILRVRGWDPVHFDPQLTRNFKTNTTLSFVYSTLLRHKVGAGTQPGTFTVEPHLAERWETPDDTTYIFHLPPLRKGCPRSAITSHLHPRPPRHHAILSAQGGAPWIACSYGPVMVRRCARP